jgi:diamine N-acetyltransferase
VDDLPYILSLEADPETATFIEAWDLERHWIALDDADLSNQIVEANGVPVGFIITAGLKTGVELELRRLVIGPKGCGIGRLALRAWLAWARGQPSAQHIWLDAYEDNGRARSLYESEGFNPVEKIRDEDGRTLIVFDFVGDPPSLTE